MSGGHDPASRSLAAASAAGAAPASSSAAALQPAASAAGAVDVLSEVLRTVRLTGALFFVVDASTPWLVPVPAARAFASILLPGAEHLISYHIVTRGTCWGGVLGEAPERLEAGDVVVFPHGDAYALASEPGVRGDDGSEEALAFFRSMACRELPLVVSEGGGGQGRIGVVCGFLGCDLHPFNPVLAALPRLLHVRRSPGAAPDALSALVELTVGEAQERRAGGECVVQRLGELMFVEVVRRHLAALPAGDTGWLAGLRDPVVGRALALLHARPADPWTLEGLARAACVSRSVLAERFSSLVGQPPMQYLTHWRLQLAARRLTDRTAKVAAVAREVGYESEAAFSRAFKRRVGSPPAEWRRRAAASES